MDDPYRYGAGSQAATNSRYVILSVFMILRSVSWNRRGLFLSQVHNHLSKT